MDQWKKLPVIVAFWGLPAVMNAAGFPPPGAEYQPPLNAPNIAGSNGLQSLNGQVSSNAPVIAGWNESARPGESVTLTGTRFTLVNGSDAGSDTTVWAWDGAQNISLVIVRVTPVQLTVTLPTSISYSTYFLWVGNEAGISAPVAVNHTNPQWIGPLGSIATAGSAKRVFGKDLSTDHGTTTSSVFLQAAGGGPFVSAKVTTVEPYAVGFQVPSLPNGNYRVYVHNGHGGNYGWGTPLTLTIATPRERGSSAVELQPSGTDDSANIQAALDSQAALPKGGTVQLSAGTFIIRHQLSIHADVHLQGAGKDLTTVQIQLASTYNDAVQIMGNEVEIQGIGWQLTGGIVPTYNIIESRPFPTAWQDIQLDDIRIGYSPAMAATTNVGANVIAIRLEVSNSEFYVEFGLTEADQWVHNNTFHGGTYLGNGGGTEAAIELQALDRTVIENNTIQTPAWSANPAIGSNICRRVATGSLNVASIVNLYIAHNTGIDVAPGPGENKGELFLFHGGSSPWYGQVVSNSGTTMTVRTDGLIDGQALPSIYNYGGSSYSGRLADPMPMSGKAVVLSSAGTFGQVGMFATIIGGTGTGQIRQVTGVTSDTISVVSPWHLPPDNTSKIVLTYVYKDIVVYENNIASFPVSAIGTISNSGASTLLVFDGNAWFNVADTNSSQRTFFGGRIGGSALDQSMWNVYQDNQLLDLRQGGMFLVNWENTPPGATSQMIGPVTLGNAFRGNSVQISGLQMPVQNPDQSVVFQLASTGGDVWNGVKGETSVYPFMYHVGNIFENNTASGGRRGIYAGDWADTVYRNNTISVDNTTTATPTAPFTPQPFFIGEYSHAILTMNTLTSN